MLANRKFSVDVFQREYRWGQKQIEQMLSDFQSTFEGNYDPNDHDTTDEVEGYQDSHTSQATNRANQKVKCKEDNANP